MFYEVVVVALYDEFEAWPLHVCFFLTLSVASNGMAFNELCIGKVIGHGRGPLRSCSIIYVVGLGSTVQCSEGSLSAEMEPDPSAFVSQALQFFTPSRWMSW